MPTTHVRRTPHSGWSGPVPLRRGLGRVPPIVLVLSGVISLQVGAALATQLFALTGPVGTVTLRLLFAAVILLLVWRPSVRVDRHAVPVVLGYGVVLAGMNMSFYAAIARIPLGLAVTVEFLGPLTIALLAARRWWHVLWAALAAGGVALLTKGGATVSWSGVLFALGAATGWGCYVPLSAALGEKTTGGGGLAWGMAVGALIAAPVGVLDAGRELLNPAALAAGLGVALLASVVPYSVELEALRRMPPGVFGVLMSLEPAVAALAGLVILGQELRPAQWVAVVLVVVASIGVTYTADRRRSDPAMLVQSVDGRTSPRNTASRS